MKERIKSLDGLRFFAALGVLWIHSWTAHGNPRFYIAGFDITKILAIGGNGVDLFFVISGFCMYYFYAKNHYFNYHDFLRFLIKRWIRLSPAFYVSTVAYLLLGALIFHDKALFVCKLFTSVFYLNSIFPQYNSASHFWTLGVEWQFYLIIPFILIYQNRIGFNKVFLSIIGLLLLSAVVSVITLKNDSDYLTNQLIFRGVEFGCGIMVGRLILKEKSLITNHALWLVIFIIVLYTGRILISKPTLSLSLYYYNIFKIFGFTLMGIGFGGVLYLTLLSKKWLSAILGNRLFKTMGKISYSFYLWHALISPVIASLVITQLPGIKGILGPIITTVVSTVILYPISQLSYKLLEKPFLASGNLTTK